MKEHYKKMVEDTNKRVIRALHLQNMDRESPFCGAFIQEDGVYQAKSTIYKLSNLIAGYLNKDTAYYHSNELYDRILMAFDYIKSVQHENGLFDYITCNFYSAPDTAFCIKKLVPVVEYFHSRKDIKWTEHEYEIKKSVEYLVYRGAKGLLCGGFHTPNHRWAIASMLAICGKLFSDKELMYAAEIYLKEGIDCNEDGEFSEKSAGNYNRINNDAMITLSEAFEDSSYEQYAIRNLRMMLTYFEPDDSIFTANSTRFDKDLLIFPKDYYYEYLSLGVRYQIPEFIGMANYIFVMVEQKQISSPDFLMQLMYHPELADYESELVGIPKQYQAFYKESGIARVRKQGFTYTVMGGKSNFLCVHNGTIKLEMKVAGSFCEHRAFRAETIQQDGDVFRLHQTMRGWYYLPFEEAPKTSDWWKMDHAKRPKKQGPDMEIDVAVHDVLGGVDVEIITSGVSGAPWRIELAFGGIERISNEHLDLAVRGNEVLVLKDSWVEASNINSSIKVGPAFATHRFTEGKEDSEARTPGMATVYFTDYTEFRHVIQVRVE